MEDDLPLANAPVSKACPPEAAPASTSPNLGTYLNRILKARNWANIVLRNSLRENLIRVNSIALDEKLIFSYLNELNNDQLMLIRYRVFKLAQDHYVCKLIERLQVAKPRLNPFEFCTQQGSTSHFMIKCNTIKDIIELIEFIVDTRQTLPDRFLPASCNCSCSSCTSCCMNDESSRSDDAVDDQSVLSEGNYLKFPLGQKCLMNQMNAIKILRARLHRHQSELEDLRKSTSDVQKLEKNFHLCYERFQSLKKENQAYVYWIKVLLVIISFLILIISILLRLR